MNSIDKFNRLIDLYIQEYKEIQPDDPNYLTIDIVSLVKFASECITPYENLIKKLNIIKEVANL